MNMRNRFGAGEFEYVMAYGDMDFAGTDDFGSIGLHGHTGPLDVFGWPYGWEGGVSAAYNGLSDELKRNKVICWDYTGPEATQFDVQFQVRVDETAAGQTLPLDFISQVSGMGDNMIANAISVAGNITLAEFDDVTIEENASFDITVVFVDAEDDANVISVEGDYISAEVTSHEIGSVVTITPDANWHGETMVTVTVADASVASDKAMQTFALTVNSDGVEPVVATPPAPPEKVEQKSSSGSLSWLMLLVASLTLSARRKTIKSS